jgi:hypothetical protein
MAEDVGDLEAIGNFLSGFKDDRAQKKAAAAKAAAKAAAPTLARAAPQYLDAQHPSAPLAPGTTYVPTRREEMAQNNFLARQSAAAHDSFARQQPEAGPAPTTEQMTGQAPRGLATVAEGAPRGDFSMAAHRRVPILTSSAVVPNRATPAEMDAMSNADYLATRDRGNAQALEAAAPPEQSPYRQGGFVRDVEPEASPYPANPYRLWPSSAPSARPTPRARRPGSKSAPTARRRSPARCSRGGRSTGHPTRTAPTPAGSSSWPAARPS